MHQQTCHQAPGTSQKPNVNQPKHPIIEHLNEININLITEEDKEYSFVAVGG